MDKFPVERHRLAIREICQAGYQFRHPDGACQYMQRRQRGAYVSAFEEMMVCLSYKRDMLKIQFLRYITCCLHSVTILNDVFCMIYRF